MKKIDAAIIGLIGLYSVSCRVCTYTQSENKSCMQFVEHLTVVDKILNDTILYGWCARRMRPEDDINAYHMLYDTGTWYRMSTPHPTPSSLTNQHKKSPRKGAFLSWC